jgi:hypothetical protein
MTGMAATVDDAVATCPAQCPAYQRPADTRSAECIAAGLQDETKATLCLSESSASTSKPPCTRPSEAIAIFWAGLLRPKL